MDRALFIAGNGARELMHRQDVETGNLANASTPGFRQEIAVQRTAPVIGGPGLRTRAFAVETTPASDMTRGEMSSTGRELDVAIQGEGWFAVRTPDGGEAYTRAGSFNTTPDGTLIDSHGRPVLGNGDQPIVLPPTSKVAINQDGSIAAVSNLDPRDSQQVGSFKLVNPPANTLVRGGDGLFRPRQGGVAQVDPTVQVSSGMLEGSNVNPVDTMVDMIAAARQFDVQVQLMQSSEQNQKAATQILSLNG
jgi:flagellar basal-body rod protein FlgF